MERFRPPRIKELLRNGVFALGLLTTREVHAAPTISPRPIVQTQEQIPNQSPFVVTSEQEQEQDEVSRAIEEIRERFGIEVVGQPDLGLSSSPLKKTSCQLDNEVINFTPTLEMMKSVEDALEEIPNPGFLVQRMIFFPMVNSEVCARYVSDPFGEGEAWISIFIHPDLPLSEEAPFSIRGYTKLPLSDYRSLLKQIVMHEFGHALADMITYLADPQGFYENREWQLLFDSENPLLRTFAKVAGFEFVEPVEERACLEQFDIETCRQMRKTKITPYGGAFGELHAPIEGWVKEGDKQNPIPVSIYESFLDITESFSECLTAYTLKPNLLDENQRIYFGNIFNGLRSKDPKAFLLAVVENPEILLEGTFFQPH